MVQTSDATARFLERVAWRYFVVERKVSLPFSSTLRLAKHG